MSPYEALIAPFSDYAFMRRALAGCVALSFGAAPAGVLMTLRRMSLVGDAMAHAILPGAAVGFLLFGLKVVPMTIGGLAAGLFVALAAGLVARTTVQREDSSLAAFYLISLALGVMIVSVKGSNVDLMHVLFGTVLALDDTALIVLGLAATVNLLGLAIIIRPLVAECVDPSFLAVMSQSGGGAHLAFLVTAVLGLVAGFQALGTLLAVGMMMLPAAASRFWARSLEGMMMLAIAGGIGASVLGLLVSFHFGVPSGPAITLSAGAFYLVSLMFGPVSGAIWNVLPQRHRAG
ncbi:MAG: metal ABC transporter permease [Hyphomicrobiaceae bacterium]